LIPEALAALPLPLRALGVEIRSTAAEYAERSHSALGERLVVPLAREEHFLAEFALLDLGGLVINSGRISPLISRQELNDRATLLMSYGGRCSYRLGTQSHVVRAGDTLVTNNDGGAYHCGYCSGIALTVDCAIWQRSAQDLLDGTDLPEMLSLVALNEEDSISLFSFFAHIDQLLERDRYLPVALGLGKQLYRYLAVSFLREAGQYEQLKQRQAGRRRWCGGLDSLVDYIRTNRAVPLTMTDLERLSHYSARHLTTLFRERFNCTPMQFVRRQRLGLAMERLAAPQPGDTVIRIARECGYRHAANFSVDFQREFGSKPSDVLRLSRSTRSG
jgi:AraC-like DNA-binding protein